MKDRLENSENQAFDTNNQEEDYDEENIPISPEQEIEELKQ